MCVSDQTARQLLTLPSQAQQKRQMQEQLMRLSSGPTAAQGAEADLSRCLPPKALADERLVCSYAFDVSCAFVFVYYTIVTQLSFTCYSL